MSPIVRAYLAVRRLIIRKHNPTVLVQNSAASVWELYR